MNSMLNKIKNWFKEAQRSPAEKYLSTATDLCDLERKQKQLSYKGIY